MVPVAFWVFVGAVVVAGIWRQVAYRREAQMTIRLAIEKGQPLDPAVIEKLLHADKGGDHDMGPLPGVVLLAIGIGLPVMGFFMSLAGEMEQFYKLTGVGSLLGVLGAALLVTWFFGRRHQASGPPAG
jgi:hypothetical protein